MKCNRHEWDTEDKEWCWKCEELTLNQIKEKYEDKFCDNCLQRDRGDKEISPVFIGAQKN
jgi:hypothetical protein